MSPGDRVFIKSKKHPWSGEAGELVAFEKYGLGWMAWRVQLDNGASCYANAEDMKTTD